MDKSNELDHIHIRRSRPCIPITVHYSESRAVEMNPSPPPLPPPPAAAVKQKSSNSTQLYQTMIVRFFSRHLSKMRMSLVSSRCILTSLLQHPLPCSVQCGTSCRPRLICTDDPLVHRDNHPKPLVTHMFLVFVSVCCISLSLSVTVSVSVSPSPRLSFFFCLTVSLILCFNVSLIL